MPAARSRASAEDAAAHNLVNDAVMRGALVRPDACSECGVSPPPRRDGGTQIEAHHDDYNRPLDVRWLCKRCHRAWHRVNVVVPRRAEIDPAADALTAPDLLDALLAGVG